MTNALDQVVIVGASAAGLTAAETLRRRNFTGSIQLVGDEIHAPYDRPPLSKQVLTGEWEPERVALRQQANLDQLAVDFHLGRRAVALDTAGRNVTLDDGEHLHYDGLIIATGVVPRTLPFARDLAGVHTLRTLDDALALRENLTRSHRLVVIGAGFLGCEVAAVAQTSGMDVTIVDPLTAPMVRQFGDLIGAHMAALHRERGVHVRCGVGVRSLTGDSRVSGVELTTGEIIPADVVLVAIGSVPATAWLEGSGLALDDGIMCDSRCQAGPNVYAAGDVTRWWHETLGATIRVEHRMNATEQAIAAASNLLGANTPFVPLPFFWTDQYDARIQGYGTFPAGSSPAITHGSLEQGRFVARYVHNGRLVGVLASNMPKELRAERARIGEIVAEARI